MCSIHGIAFQKGHTTQHAKTADPEAYEERVRNLITNLMLKGMQRGRTASGICYTSGRKMTIVKDKLDAESFVKTEFYKESLKKYVTFKGDHPNHLLSVMGHCRQKTKGTEQNNENNHPIRYKNVVGVHNGIISNDDVQFEKYKDIFNRNAQVDSEIIFALIDHFSTVTDSIPKGIQKACSNLSGGYACAMVHSHQPHILWLFKAHSPCTIYHFEKSGIIMFASQTSFITDTIDENSMGDHTEIYLDANEGIGFDLYRNKYQRFDLETTVHTTRRIL